MFRHAVSVFGVAVLCAGFSTVSIGSSYAGAGVVTGAQGMSRGVVTERSLYLSVSSDADLKGAEKFIDGLASEGIGFLSNPDLTEDQMKASFKKLLQGKFDLPMIGRFTLGRYWRTATEAQKKEYLDLFEKMIVNVYSNRFSDYKGQSLVVGSARAEGAKDILVTSTLEGTGGNEPDVQVDWRVRKSGSRYKVIDVIVEGVSMAVTQRSDFASVIQRGGGKVDVLIAHLEQQ